MRPLADILPSPRPGKLPASARASSWFDAAGTPAWRRIAVVCGVVIFAAFWFGSLASRSLISSDEGRYASLSLAMLQSGDWVTPRLNGLLYFEKPPLQYWAGAAAMWLFGINEFAARLWPGLTGLGTIILVAVTASRLWGRAAGWHAFFIAGATTWICVNSHFLSLDAGLCCALTLTLCGLLLADHYAWRGSQAQRWILAAWLGMALGLLSKGLVAIVIPGTALVLCAAWRRDWSPWLHLRWLAGLAIVLIVAAPWFILVSLRNPDFATFFFIHEHFQRFLTTTHRREGSWWYFIPYLAAGALPWTGALPWLFRPQPRSFARDLLIVWSLFIFVFFSASGSKLPSYILPMFPALALLATEALQRATPKALRAILLVAALAWCAGLVAASQMQRFFAADVPPAAVDSLRLGIVTGGVMFLTAAVLALRLLNRGRTGTALAIVAMAHCYAILFVVQSHNAFGQLKSAGAIARAIAPRIDTQDPVFAVRDYEQTLPFYLRRPVILVDYVDEFAFGEAHEPERWIPSLDDFVARWRIEPMAAAYMKRPTLDVLLGRGVPMQIVYEDARRVVVVKPRAAP